MKLLPKKYKKRFSVKRGLDSVSMSGRKGGRVKRQQMEARMMDKELQNYSYR